MSPLFQGKDNCCQLQVVYGVISFMCFQLSGSIATTCPSCINTHPNPRNEASVVTTYAFPGSGIIKIGAVVSLLFNSSNDCWHFSVHSNLVPFFVSAVNGPASFAKSCTTFDNN